MATRSKSNSHPLPCYGLPLRVMLVWGWDNLRNHCWPASEGHRSLFIWWRPLSSVRPIRTIGLRYFCFQLWAEKALLVLLTIRWRRAFHEVQVFFDWKVMSQFCLGRDCLRRSISLASRNLCLSDLDNFSPSPGENVRWGCLSLLPSNLFCIVLPDDS